MESMSEELPHSNLVIRQTKRWIEEVVIEQQFCPFAWRVYENQQIRYCVTQEVELEPSLQILIEEMVRLNQEPDIATSLLIFTCGFSAFEAFLDLLELGEKLLVAQGYQGVYQLASFHPQYCFQGVDSNDASNFTNRSPYPMLHVLREDSLEQVIQHYADVEQIPQRNIDHARCLGKDKLSAMLQACLETAKDGYDKG